MGFITSLVSNNASPPTASVTLTAGQQMLIFAMDPNRSGDSLTISDGTNAYTTRGNTSDTYAV
jgi:hypothetical protein